MENKKGGDFICMRPDSIVEARFNLTKKQNDIMDIVFATIENDDKLQYEIDVSKYAKLYNLQNQSHVYEDLKKAAKTFEGKGFAITQKVSEKKESRIYFSWFSSIEYIDGEGRIIVELGQRLKQLLLEVKRAVYYNLEYSINFNCIYSKRLYYYLKLYEDTGVRIDNLDTLRDKLECPVSYKKYSLFKQNVLQPAYEEINGNSDINFEYEEIKNKNKVTNIKFNIKSNKVNNTYEAIDEVSATVMQLEDPNESLDVESGTRAVLNILKTHKVKPLDALEIYKNANGNVQYIAKVYEYSKTQNIKTLVGFMKEMVKPGVLQDNIKTSKASNFNNFEQRNYDFDKLERQLLGWDNEVDENTGGSYQQGTFNLK